MKPFGEDSAEAGWIPHDRLAGLELLAAFRRTLVRLECLRETP